jgi:glycine cleavage system H lipoate-binding protein
MLGRLINRFFTTSKRFIIIDIKFTKSHEWVIYDSQTKSTKIGITNYAKEQLGEIVHI